jgi:hypothetical protein
MGGRGSTGATKTFSIIGAARNKPMQDARSKEIADARAAEAASAAKQKPQRTTKTKSRVIEKKGTVSQLMRSGRKEYGSYGADILERRDLPSIARAGDLHLTKGAKSWQFIVSDNVSGYSVREFQSRKAAISFMQGVTRADGTTSPTLRRQISRLVDDEKTDKTMRSTKAFYRYNERRRKLGID